MDARSLPTSVSARSFAEHDPCRFRPSTKPGVRVVCRLTARCTLLCDHCLASAAGNVRSEDLSLERWKKILAELNDIGAHKVLLTGGEPLLFSGLTELTKYISAMGISTDLNSTLWFMTRQLAAELADAGLTEASVSIEGPDAVHDFLHGRPGALQRLRDGVKMLQDVGVLLDGSMCVMPANVDHVHSMIEEAARLRLGSFTISRMLPIGHGLRYAGPQVGDERLRELYDSLEGARLGQYGIPVRCVGLLGAPTAADCQQGQSIIGIRANGVLTPCVLTRDEFPEIPLPEHVGLKAAFAEMRVALQSARSMFCFGN